MKKIMKIGALSLALIASLLLLSSDRTNAAAGQVSFIISGTTNTQCTYGTSWNIGTYSSSLSAFTASGNLTNFVCTDTQGLASWNMTLQATTAVSNGTTAIPATGVSMRASTNTVTNGTCFTGANTTTLTQIGSSAGTIMAKSSAVNQVCQITTSSVTLNVAVPAAASIGTYSGTLSLTLPW